MPQRADGGLCLPTPKLGIFCREVNPAREEVERMAHFSCVLGTRFRAGPRRVQGIRGGSQPGSRPPRTLSLGLSFPFPDIVWAVGMNTGRNNSGGAVNSEGDPLCNWIHMGAERWGTHGASESRPDQRKRNSSCPQAAERLSPAPCPPILGPQSVQPRCCHSWGFTFPVKACD